MFQELNKDVLFQAVEMVYNQVYFKSLNLGGDCNGTEYYNNPQSHAYTERVVSNGNIIAEENGFVSWSEIQCLAGPIDQETSKTRYTSLTKQQDVRLHDTLESFKVSWNLSLVDPKVNWKKQYEKIKSVSLVEDELLEERLKEFKEMCKKALILFDWCLYYTFQQSVDIDQSMFYPSVSSTVEKYNQIIDFSTDKSKKCITAFQEIMSDFSTEEIRDKFLEREYMLLVNKNHFLMPGILLPIEFSSDITVHCSESTDIRYIRVDIPLLKLVVFSIHLGSKKDGVDGYIEQYKKLDTYIKNISIPNDWLIKVLGDFNHDITDKCPLCPSIITTSKMRTDAQVQTKKSRKRVSENKDWFSLYFENKPLFEIVKELNLDINVSIKTKSVCGNTLDLTSYLLPSIEHPYDHAALCIENLSLHMKSKED